MSAEVCLANTNKCMSKLKKDKNKVKAYLPLRSPLSVFIRGVIYTRDVLRHSGFPSEEFLRVIDYNPRYRYRRSRIDEKIESNIKAKDSSP